MTVPDAPVHYDCTRIGLIDALGSHPLGEFLNLEAKGRMADRLLEHLPVASDAGFYMEGVKAERTRIADLADDVNAGYEKRRPCNCGQATCPGVLVASHASFANLILEQP